MGYPIFQDSLAPAVEAKTKADIIIAKSVLYVETAKPMGALTKVLARYEQVAYHHR